MPNPLMNSGTPNQSKSDSVDRAGEYAGPHAVTPVLEHESPSTVFAYRGTETHGVEPTEQYAPPPDAGDTVSAFVDIPKEAPDPIPVRVVNESISEIVAGRCFQTFITSTPTAVLGRDTERKSAKLRVRAGDLNAGAYTVWLSFTADGGGVSLMQAYPCSADTDIAVNAQDAIFMFAQGLPPNTMIPVYVFVEWSEPNVRR
jgi:hypothetical protein